MAEPKPIDEINGLQLREQATELVSYALELMNLGFTLPITWWRDHIVEDPSEKLTRRLTVDGPVVHRAAISIFDSYDKCCVLLMNYTNAAYESFWLVMDQAEHLLCNVMNPGRVFQFSELRTKEHLSRPEMRILTSMHFLVWVKHSGSDDIMLALSKLPRDWHHDIQTKPIRTSFAQWRDHVGRNLHMTIIQELVNNYLALREPERFGGGA